VRRRLIVKVEGCDQDAFDADQPRRLRQVFAHRRDTEESIVRICSPNFDERGVRLYRSRSRGAVRCGVGQSIRPVRTRIPCPHRMAADTPALAPRLNLFDATMLVMGGIIGAGIFMNPAVVAQEVNSPTAAIGAWLVGGAFALLGAFVYAELAARRPAVGGQYAYLREAFNPLAAFLYAWTLLLVSQSGGMAAVAMTFARYFRELTAVAASDGTIALVTLAVLTIVNCYGVRAGSNLQSTFMILKIGAIAMLIGYGFGAPASQPAPVAEDGTGAAGFGAALVPVLFAYGGWQTSGFVAGELRNARRDLPRGLLMGVSGVVLLYVLVNIVCLRVLGMDGLARTTTPASDVMRAALGERGATLIAAGIAFSTLGFLSQNLLTGPRVYYAMARDGVFFRRVGAVHPKTRAPVMAIIVQSVVAALLVLTGSYERILGYVVAIDWLFFGLTALALIVLRRRDRDEAEPSGRFRAPGHPYTTIVFVVCAWLVVVNTVYRFPADTLAGVGLLVAGVPVYYFWRRQSGSHA
jgi:APA family basic amino acid/polyamine antiporter